jgi:hypothetical protein
MSKVIMVLCQITAFNTCFYLTNFHSFLKNAKSKTSITLLRRTSSFEFCHKSLCNLQKFNSNWYASYSKSTTFFFLQIFNFLSCLFSYKFGKFWLIITCNKTSNTVLFLNLEKKNIFFYYLLTQVNNFFFIVTK